MGAVVERVNRAITNGGDDDDAYQIASSGRLLSDSPVRVQLWVQIVHPYRCLEEFGEYMR